jgi:hypothetical protein
MRHHVPHPLGREKARQVAEQALAAYKERFAEYHPSVDWIDDSCAHIGFRVKGIQLNGAVQVLADTIALDLDVPFLLRPFKGMALAVIEDEIRKWIAEAR